MAYRWNIVLPGVACILAAATLLGCARDGGTPTAEEYEASVVDTRDLVDFALARIQEATSEDDFLDRLEDAGASIDDAARDLDEAGAPARFEDENARLVRHLRQLAASLEGTAGQARELGYDTLLAGAAGLNFESWDAVNAVLGDLREQGVQVQPLLRH